MAYIVLARKWRPAQFSDIVGQSATIRTLSNAIESDRIHHAYLFTGSRGVGKTSIARIFSKVLRCQNPVKLDGFLKSCDACADCREIAAGTSMDVIEIDGASNNGVENVRDIRESARFAPSSGTKKIYIIDEVHMLSTAAFNALLKTLEEPPAHVVFIFATTEPHKIPATILSRCQRFDFKRVTQVQMIERLKLICTAESITPESGVLPLIARAAEGSMRDSLSLLDQVIAFSGNTITLAQTRESLGLVEGQIIVQILENILAREPVKALETVEQAFAQGFDLRVLARTLLETLHALILLKVGAKPSSSFELSSEETTQLKTLAALRQLEELELIFQVIHHGIEAIARSAQPKIILDLILIKCATAEVLAPAHSVSAPSAPIGYSTDKQNTASVAPQTASAISVPTKTVSSDLVSPSISSSEPRAKTWEGFIEIVKQTRPALGTTLESAITPKIDAVGPIEIAFKADDAFKRDQVEGLYAQSLSALILQYFGVKTGFKSSILKAGVTTPAADRSVAERKEQQYSERKLAVQLDVQNHPIIREAQTLFGGELGQIEIRDTEA